VLPEGDQERYRGQRLPDEDERQRGEHLDRGLDQVPGVQQHADGDEEQHGEGVPHGQGLGRRPQAEVRPADDQPGQERPQGHGRPEQFGRPDRDPEDENEHGQGEQLTGAGPCHSVEYPGDHPSADQEGEGDERRDLEDGQHDGQGQLAGAADLRAEHDRQQDQDEDGVQVLNNQPADRDVPGPRVQGTVVGEDAGQDDRAGHRQGQPEHDRRRPLPPECPPQQGAQRGGCPTGD
jgi:hypothetical protein